MLQLELNKVAALVGVLSIALMAGCSHETAPGLTLTAPGALSTPLTVETRVYVSRAILGQVTVTLDGLIVGTTDDAGHLDILAPVGREIWIGVARAGWQPMILSASGTLLPESHERWTFYFEQRK